MKTFKNSLSKSKIHRAMSTHFVRRVATLAGATAMGQVVIAVSSPLLTRLYTPEHLGLLSVFVGILSPILSLVAFRYEIATVLPRDDRDAINILGLSLSLVILTSAIILLLVPFVGELFLAGLGASELAPYLWLLPISTLAGGAFQVLNFWGIRRKRFKEIGKARLSQSIAAVALQLGFGFAGMKPVGLIAGDALSRASGSIRLAHDVRTSILTVGRPSLSEMKRMAIRYRRFPLYSIGPAVINSLNLQLPVLLIATQFGPGPVGLFALGQRILGTPLNLVANAVSQVFLGDAAEAANDSREQLSRRFSRGWRILLVLASAVVVPVAVVAPRAFSAIFGDQWIDAGRYVQILAPMFIAQFTSSPLGGLLDVLERQDLHLLREMLRLILMLLAVVGFQLLEQTAFNLVTMLSIAASLGYIVGLLLTKLGLVQESRISSKE